MMEREIGHYYTAIYRQKVLDTIESLGEFWKDPEKMAIFAFIVGGQRVGIMADDSYFYLNACREYPILLDQFSLEQLYEYLAWAEQWAENQAKE